MTAEAAASSSSVSGAIAGAGAESRKGIGLRQVLLGLAILTPPAAMLFIIHRYGVNVPYWDEWDMLSVVPKAYDGTLDWGSIWGQQLEHRSVTAKIVSILLAKTTQLNLVDEMYLGFGFNLGSLLLIWNMLARSLRERGRPLVAPLAIVASLLLCWPVTFEIWTWGIASFQYFSASFWAVLTVWAVTRWPGRWEGVAVAAISTTAAIFTTGHGFALIPVGILGMLACGAADRKMRWARIGLFSLIGLWCVIAYLQGYTSPGHQPTDELTHYNVAHLVRYFLTYIGSPFWTPESRLSRYFGVLGLVVAGGGAYYLIRSMRDWLKVAMPWMLLACYTLVNAGVTMVGRIRFGVYQAASSRYSAITILFWISTIAIS